MLKRIFIIGAAILLLLTLGIVLLTYYVRTHKEQVVAKIKETANEHINGELNFDDIDVVFFPTFPDFSFQLKNVSIAGPDSLDKPMNLLQFEDVYLNLSLRKLLKKKIELKSIKLSNGQVNIYLGSNGVATTDVFKKNENKSKSNNQGLLDADAIEITLNNVGFLKEDVDYFQKLSFTLNDVTVGMLTKDDRRDLQVDLDALVNYMAFDVRRGKFLPNAPVNGKFNAVWKNDSLVAEPFLITVQGMTFASTMFFKTEKAGDFRLTFENPETHWEPAMMVLTDRIRDALKSFKIEGDIHTKTVIAGKQMPRHPALVTVDFQVEDQKAQVSNIELKHFTTDGRLVTRWNPAQPDSIYSRRDITILLNSLVINDKDFQILTKNFRFSNSPGKNLQSIDLGLHVNGNTSVLNDLLKNTDFFFKKGTFAGDIASKGISPSLKDDLWKFSNARFTLKNNDVYYKTGRLTVPIPLIDFAVDERELDLLGLHVRLGPQSLLKFNGKVANYGPLITGEKSKVPTTSNLQLSANTLVWDEIKDLFKKNPNKEHNTDVGRLKSLLTELNKKFHPSIGLRVNQFKRGDFVADRVNSALAFRNDYELSLQNTGFDFQNGAVRLDGDFAWNTPQQTNVGFTFRANDFNGGAFVRSLDYFNIPTLKAAGNVIGLIDLDLAFQGLVNDETGFQPANPNRPPDVNLSLNTFSSYAKGFKVVADKSSFTSSSLQNKQQVDFGLHISGNTAELNELLQNINFFFKEGTLTGDIVSKGVSQNMKKDIGQFTSGHFVLQNSVVYYKPAELTVSVPLIDFTLDENELDLLGLNLALNDSTRLQFDGKVTNYGALFYDSKNKEPTTSRLNLTANTLAWEDIQDLFKKNPTKDTTDIGRLKFLLTELNKQFHPSVSLRVNKFKQGKFVADSVSTALTFQGDRDLSLQNTGFHFQDGLVRLDGDFAWNTPALTNVAVKFLAKDFNAGDFLRSFNYFNVGSLENAEKIAGRIDLDANLTGTFNDITGLQKHSVDGSVYFDFWEGELIDFVPVVKIGDLLFRKERVRNMIIPQLKGYIFINNSVVKFPKTPFSSSAISFYFEGVMDYAGTDSRMFVIVPMSNFNHRDVYEVPDIQKSKGGKIYIDAIEDKSGNMSYMLRLRDRRHKKSYQKKVERRQNRVTKKKDKQTDKK